MEAAGGGPGGFGRTLIGIGLALALVGVVLVLVERFTGGKGLPGDIVWGRGNVRAYFPLGTMLLLSLLLTVVLNVVLRLWRL